MAKSKKNIIIEMTTPKRGPGRPRKDVVVTDKDIDGADIPGLFQPTEHDLTDELSRLDSYSYSSYNE